MSRHMKTMDGNNAAAYVSYAFTDVAAIYPITPSSPMAETVDEMAAHGATNIFGQKVKVVEMQSEGGAAGALHGSLAAGALTTTYTASQGLLLMIPNMYKIAGELLPCVFHVSARTVAAHALCIFGDHSDVMACRQTGFAMLASSSVQEAEDMAAIAHLSTIKGRVPFLHFFDGFRTSHEIQKIELVEYDDLKKLVDMDAVEAFKKRSLNPEHPAVRGTAQNGDIFFQAKEAAQSYYNALPAIVENYMQQYGEITGRKYKLFDYVGAPDADRIIIAMGSVCECAEELVNHLVKNGEKVGLVKVRLYRPWTPEKLKEVIPATVKKIAVLDRTKEPGSFGEPLYMDVKAMYYGADFQPVIVGGRYGLGSKDTTPGQVLAVFENLKADEPKNNFTVGIYDDVYGSSLPVKEITTEPEGTVRCKFWGLGSDGTVGANKQAIKIIGDHTDMYAQGYFHYDSKKSGGVTISHLRFGKNRIQSTYLITEADYIACHNQAYVHQYNVTAGLKKGGVFLLNCIWSDEELETELPNSMKKNLALSEAQFYTVNGTKLGRELGLGNKINMIMQSAFFNLTQVIPTADAEKYLKDSIKKSYGKKGDDIVNMNYKAVDAGMDPNAIHRVEIPAHWKDLEVEKAEKKDNVPEFISEVAIPMNRQEGDFLPVSKFVGRENGEFPVGTTKYEKRGVAVSVPEWNPAKCIQCNQCSFVCPHSAIRPVLLNEEEAANAPETLKITKCTTPALSQYKFTMAISTLDCLGCGNCVDVCPAKQTAIKMMPLETQPNEAANWEYTRTVKEKAVPNPATVKNSQFRNPYFEFSGACAGCGETPYIKVVTQLFGDRMMIANATGCSSIWGASAPNMPYTTDANGRGPSWANSLFEDNAEYGLGMLTGVQQIRSKIEDDCRILAAEGSDAVKAAAQAWIDGKDDGEGTRERADALVAAIEAEMPEGTAAEAAKDVITKKDHLVKKSVWCLGGDGWAYDIGYGGLDHVLASGEDINVLVFDTEVYSNTGGQASKATPTAAIAKFAASGKKIKKKDLGMMAASYGYVYVAQCAMGADKNQFVRAVKEAESYHGPSLIICYAPCINHGIKGGMTRTQSVEKEAVDCGYWQLYRYDPQRLEAGHRHAFMLDSKEPSGNFRDFIMSEVRYSSLKKEFPDQAEELFERTEKDAKARYEGYKKMTE